MPNPEMCWQSEPCTCQGSSIPAKQKGPFRLQVLLRFTEQALDGNGGFNCILIPSGVWLGIPLIPLNANVVIK